MQSQVDNSAQKVEKSMRYFLTDDVKLLHERKKSLNILINEKLPFEFSSNGSFYLKRIGLHAPNPNCSALILLCAMPNLFFPRTVRTTVDDAFLRMVNHFGDDADAAVTVLLHLHSHLIAQGIDQPRLPFGSLPYQRETRFIELLSRGRNLLTAFIRLSSFLQRYILFLKNKCPKVF